MSKKRGESTAGTPVVGRIIRTHTDGLLLWWKHLVPVLQLGWSGYVVGIENCLADRDNILLIPLRIPILQEHKDGEEDVDPEFEHFEVGSSHCDLRITWRDSRNLGLERDWHQFQS
jgi:hypothetical protein